MDWESERLWNQPHRHHYSLHRWPDSSS